MHESSSKWFHNEPKFQIYEKNLEKNITNNLNQATLRQVIKNILFSCIVITRPATNIQHDNNQLIWHINEKKREIIRTASKPNLKIIENSSAHSCVIDIFANMNPLP